LFCNCNCTPPGFNRASCEPLNTTVSWGKCAPSCRGCCWAVAPFCDRACRGLNEGGQVRRDPVLSPKWQHWVIINHFPPMQESPWPGTSEASLWPITNPVTESTSLWPITNCQLYQGYCTCHGQRDLIPELGHKIGLFMVFMGMAEPPFPLFSECGLGWMWGVRVRALVSLRGINGCVTRPGNYILSED
jgi:hypothetical protein